MGRCRSLKIADRTTPPPTTSAPGTGREPSPDGAHRPVDPSGSTGEEGQAEGAGRP